MDDQVKLRGFRIELGEIEYHLSEHDQVVSAAVVVKEQAGDKCLVAYYVAEAEIESLVLKAYLLDKLPNYMVPAYFVHLNAFPLTTNGKLDKKRLPEPEVKVNASFLRPKNQTQRELITIWGTVLNLAPEQIGVSTNFFDIGGNSLKMVKMTSLVNAHFNVEITVADVFRFPLISQISDLIDKPSTTELSQEDAESKAEDALGQLNETLNLFNKFQD
jgi:acyl carrier protein